MVQLDGLRAVAVLAVMIRHYHEVDAVQIGLAGVKLFFVLSGFLITGILLTARLHVQGSAVRLGSALTTFYVRRTLRIFPLYYLVVVAGLILGVEAARDGAAWFLLYLSNFYMSELGWYPAHFAHFWSLAVEEQFYLVWPWLVLLLPGKWLWRAILLAVAAGPAFRFFAVVAEIPAPASFVSTFACLDSLGLGALLALLRHERPTLLTAGRSWTGCAAGLALLLVAAAIPSVAVNYALSDLAFSLSAACLIDRAANGIAGPAGAMLAARPMTYTGRISYGLYVYHPLMPGIWTWLDGKTGLLGHASEAVTILLYWLSAFAIAALSWRFFEGPVNGLKDRLAPSTKAAAAAAARPAIQTVSA